MEPALVGLPVTNDMFNIVNFIRSIYSTARSPSV